MSDTDQTIRFDDRVVIVTGAGNGLGRAYAKALASRGASVVVNDLGTDSLGNREGVNPADQVVAEIVSEGGKAVASNHSCATRAGGTAIIETALDTFGRLDSLIHNAGFLRNGPFEDLTDDQIQGITDVHVGACFYLGQPAFKAMKDGHYGRMVFISSSAGMFGSRWQTNYGAAKAGVVGLMNNLAHEGAPHGIRVNSLMPSAFTRLGRGEKDFPPDFHQAAPAGWEGVFDPALSQDYVVPMAVWLASEACTATQHVYGATGGRFSRVFVGMTEGWQSDFTKRASPEDIARNIARIDDTSTFSTPMSMFDEFAEIVRSRETIAAGSA